MTLLATKLPPAAMPERIVAAWNAFAARSNPRTVIVAAVVALTAPAVIFQGNAADDGAVVSIAGFAIGSPAGTFGPIIARLPAALSVLFAALLIDRLLRRLSASAPAALFGAALLLACPLVIYARASISAELPLATLLFFAFYLWWEGHAKGSLSVVRWLVIAGALIVAFLLEGPRAANPTFFSGGAVGAFTRILGDALPAVLGAAAYLLARGYDVEETSVAGFVRPGFVAAVACYAVASAVFVLLWPGGMGRYYVPTVLALCVLGGLGYDRLRMHRPLIIAPLLMLTIAFLAYALFYAFSSNAA